MKLTTITCDVCCEGTGPDIGITVPRGGLMDPLRIDLCAKCAGDLLRYICGHKAIVRTRQELEARKPSKIDADALALQISGAEARGFEAVDPTAAHFFSLNDGVRLIHMFLRDAKAR